MSKLPGLFRRESRYYIRVVIPLDLRPQYASRTKLIESLGTSDYAEAKVIGSARRTQALIRFQSLRGQPLTTFDSGVHLAPSESPLPSPSPVLGRTSLRTVHAKWSKSQSRTTDSISSCLRAVQQYEACFGDKAIEELARIDGDEFRAWLVHAHRKTSTKTARDRLVWVKSLLKYACRELEILGRSPWEGLDIDVTDSVKRRPWSDAELRRFFLQPLFLSYELPIDRKAGNHAAYWIPLLGLFTGARVTELAQLRTEDVLHADQLPVIRIAEAAEEQRVKTDAGTRLIPVHNELIRLGFLDYVRSSEKNGSVWLWPDLPRREGKAGGYFSQWFGQTRRALGFSKYPDFHCLRHTVRTQLAEADVPEPTIDALLGHEIGGSTGARVYTHRTRSAGKRAIETICYAFSLPRIFRNQG